MQYARSDPQAAVDSHPSAGEPDEESLQIPPLDAMVLDPNLAFLAWCGGDVEVRHVFEIEDGFFAKTVFSFDDYRPEYFAEGLY